MQIPCTWPLFEHIECSWMEIPQPDCFWNIQLVSAQISWTSQYQMSCNYVLFSIQVFCLHSTWWWGTSPFRKVLCASSFQNHSGYPSQVDYFLKTLTSVQWISHGPDCFLNMLTSENACPMDLAAFRLHSLGLDKNPMVWLHFDHIQWEWMLNQWPEHHYCGLTGIVDSLFKHWLQISTHYKDLTVWLNIDHSWPQIWWAGALFEIIQCRWTLILWALVLTYDPEQAWFSKKR